MPIETLKEKDAMKEMERKPYSLESMRVRCPHCRKLYLVQFTDIKDAKPRFECVQCHARFWLSMADMNLTSELIGIPVQVKEPELFKLKEMNFTESTLTHSEALGLSWRKVVANYGEERLHADFLRLAQREQNLPYAAAQYNQIQKLMPGDETTHKRLHEIKALGSMLMPSIEIEESKKISRSRSSASRLWQVPLCGAALMIGVGLFVPIFRNMVGVGAAFLFLALALQIHFRRRH